MKTNPAIGVYSAVKKYGDTLALNDVSLEVFHGEVVGLLGVNGAGKTTLMESIIGMRRLESGSIAIDGLPLWRLAAG